MQQKFWQRIRLIRWLIVLGMLGTVFALFAGAKLHSVNSLLPAVIAQATCDVAKISLNNFDYCDVREGNTRWMLRATGAQYFDDRQETVLSQVSAEFYLKDGGTIELKGDEGILHNDSNNMEVSGNVRVRYDSNYTLVTERLLYDREKELIHTAAEVFLKGQGITLKGEGMRLEIARRTMCILKNIETTLQGIIVGGKKRQSIS